MVKIELIQGKMILTSKDASIEFIIRSKDIFYNLQLSNPTIKSITFYE